MVAATAAEAQVGLVVGLSSEMGALAPLRWAVGAALQGVRRPSSQVSISKAASVAASTRARVSWPVAIAVSTLVVDADAGSTGVAVPRLAMEEGAVVLQLMDMLMAAMVRRLDMGRDTVVRSTVESVVVLGMVRTDNGAGGALLSCSLGPPLLLRRQLRWRQLHPHRRRWPRWLQFRWLHRWCLS